MIIETILLFIAVILLLVVSHELGHFLTAKWFGIRVDEFGVGIPPKIWGIRFGETLYSINLLPFGGFVRIFGEEEDIADPRSFSGQRFLVRSLIVAAGVIANIIVGFLLFSFLSWYGVPKLGVEISQVAEHSPAAEAGFHAGDVVIGIKGEEKDSLGVDEVHSYIEESKGKTASFIIKRGGETLTINATPRQNPPQGEGSLGVVIGTAEVGTRRVAWYKAPWEGMKTTAHLLVLIVGGLWMLVSQLFTGGPTPGEVIGPVGIANIARESLDIGLYYFLELVAFLSLHLAVINILPIPALDGGRLLFFVIEKIRGKTIPARVAGIIHSVFFLILIAFLLWVSYKDILRLL